MSIVILIFSQEILQKYKEEKIKPLNIATNDFLLDDNGILDITSLFLDEPKLKVVFFNKDEQI